MDALAPGTVVITGDTTSQWARIEAAWLVMTASAWAPWDEREDRFEVERSVYPGLLPRHAVAVGSRWAFETAIASLRITHHVSPGLPVQLPRRAVVTLVQYFDGPRFQRGRGGGRPSLPGKTRRIRVE